MPLAHVDDDVAVVDERPHGGQLRRRRDVRFLVEKAPRPHQGPDGDVERTVAVDADAPRRFEDGDERLADPDRRTCG